MSAVFPPLASPAPAVIDPPVSWPTPFSVAIEQLPPPAALPPGTLRILVLGDSVASFLGLALRYRQDEVKAFVAARGVGSCSIFEARVRFEKGKRIEGQSMNLYPPAMVKILFLTITSRTA